MSKRKPARPIPAPPEKELLTDPEGAFDLGLGLSKFREIQRTDPDFPPPIWIGPRGKRHVRAELRRYALSKRRRVSV